MENESQLEILKNLIKVIKFWMTYDRSFINT